MPLSFYTSLFVAPLLLFSLDTPERGEEGYGLDYGEEAQDEIGLLLKRADEAPYSYETLHGLVAALSVAVRVAAAAAAAAATAVLTHFFI